MLASSMSIRWCATLAQIEKAIAAIEAAPGMVLFTLVDPQLAHRLDGGLRARLARPAFRCWRRS